MTGQKQCNTCGEFKDPSFYPPSRPSKCRQCHTEYVRGHRARHPQSYREAREKYEAENLDYTRRRIGQHHRNLSAISQVMATRKRQPWTVEEITFLIDHPELTAYQQALTLGRTYRGVHSMRSRIHKGLMPTS